MKLWRFFFASLLVFFSLIFYQGSTLETTNEIKYSSDCNVDADCNGMSKCLPLILGEKTILNRCSSNIPNICYNQAGTCPPVDSEVPMLACMPIPYETLQISYACGVITKYSMQPSIMKGCSLENGKVCSNHGTCSFSTGTMSSKRLLSSITTSNDTTSMDNKTTNTSNLTITPNTNTDTNVASVFTNSSLSGKTNAMSSLLPDMSITSARCVCYAGYGGDDCSKIVSSNCEYECSYGKGQCIDNQCYCGKQFKGQQCEQSLSVTKGNCGTEGWFDDGKNACVCRYGKKDGVLCKNPSCTDCSYGSILSINVGLTIAVMMSIFLGVF